MTCVFIAESHQNVSKFNIRQTRTNSLHTCAAVSAPSATRRSGTARARIARRTLARKFAMRVPASIFSGTISKNLLAHAQRAEEALARLHEANVRASGGLQTALASCCVR